jgi:hypothetical protein
MSVTIVGAYQRGEAVSLTLVGVRETRFAAARDSSSRALAALAGLPERSGCFFDDELFFASLSLFVDFLAVSELFSVFFSELFLPALFFETFSELLSASSFVDFFSKATLGLLTGWGWWCEATAIHPGLA